VTRPVTSSRVIFLAASPRHGPDWNSTDVQNTENPAEKKEKNRKNRKLEELRLGPGAVIELSGGGPPLQLTSTDTPGHTTGS
jgi:glyoxylase-like metal-dependent hydrolase (beta-lactamase superfamily II)